jgi:hypothetical protein
MGGWTSHSDVILYLETGSRLRNGIIGTRLFAAGSALSGIEDKVI